ncbi:MAG: zinc ribbon domain-containing protein [Patescibacteria group bacterium]|nr:zinc ribbon domain-containing protein [Patescibacteria group bacterium]MCL5431625.1 zinc ribbon domain-containing protein [Patescibacteria group bacterium]
MKCPKCSKINPDGSNFCEDCGYKLDLNLGGHNNKIKNNAVANEFDDVIFTPAKQDHTFVVVIILLVAIVFCLWFLTKLGSGGPISQQNATVPTNQPTTFPLYDLSIENQRMNWVGSQLYFEGTAKNSYSQSAKNIQVRIDFYHDKAATELFDTRYVTIPGVSESGAFTFSLPVYASPQGQFWWRFNVISADLLQ